MRLLAILFLLISSNTYARTLYVSNAGNNANSGLTTSLPWQTLAKVNSFVLASNDSILLNRGDTFYGDLIPSRGNIYVGAYGSGAKPIITGLSTVSGWVNLGGNIWEAPVINVKSTVNLVTKDNTMQAVGRYPNANAANGGYVNASAGTLTSVTTSMLSSTTNWTGAELVIRFERWDIKKTPVTSHAGGVMGFANFGHTPRVGFGVFVQRDPRTLDQDGEWYFNTSTNKVRMYFSDDNPTGHTVQIATADTLFKCPYSLVKVENIKFYGSGKFGMRFIGGAGITISNCDFENSGDEAILCKSQTSGVNIYNCTAINSLGSGIRIQTSGTSLFNGSIINCYINNTALLIGMLPSTEELNPKNAIQAVIGKMDSLRVIGNVAKNNGYCGISWDGDSTTIKNNIIDSFCSVLDDGGGIYTVENTGGASPNVRHNRFVIGNFVSNGIGAQAGTTGAFNSGVCGYYSDLGSGYIIYSGNSTFNIPGNAFHGNNNKYLTVIYNTTFNCFRSFSNQRFGDGDLMRGFAVTNNIFSDYRWQYINQAINLPSLLTVQADIAAMGTFDYNYYSTKSGVDTSLTTFTSYADKSNGTSTYRNFAYITGTALQETHSTNFANNGILYTNPTDTVRQVVFIDTIYREPNGTLDTNAVNIQPWQSKILIFVKVNVRPIVSAGGPYTITAPLTGVPVTGTATDPDGAITALKWSQLYGPSTATFTASTSLSTVVNNLVPGTYGLKFKATGSGGAQDTASSSTTITVNPAVAPPNLPPVFSPAPIVSQTLTLPTNSTTATAAATDPDGTIAGYRWYYLTGPTGSTISSLTSATPTFGNLTVGVFTYKVAAYDNTGDSSSTTFQITINPAITTPPIPSAGSDQTLQLPATATTLAGSGINGTSCAINSNTWSLISSPGGSSPVITTPSSYTSTFTNLLFAGTYVLRLTVTGVCGSTVTDDVTITVLPVYVPPSGCNCFNTFTKFEN